jgi:hypothetical protein
MEDDDIYYPDMNAEVWTPHGRRHSRSRPQALHLGRYSSYSPVDIDGKPVKRTKMSYPYAYDCHVIWRGGPNSEIKHAVYHDRMQQWDWDKFERCRKNHLDGFRFNNADPEKVEAFLREYNDDPGLRLIVIQEGCNVSNGYPYWVFHYRTDKY